jgi:pimeloyl-ACP methyl ester carboxylesterase
MRRITRADVRDVRGASTLLLEASTGIVDVVERMHRTIQRVPFVVGKPVEGPTRGITGFVYRRVRGTMRATGRGLGAVLGSLEGLLPDGESTPGRDVIISRINGIHGDYLARSGNPLALAMTLSNRGTLLDVENPGQSFAASPAEQPTGKLMVLVHGLCMSSHHWQHEGCDYGEAARSALGYAPLYLRYNSGLPIAENGRLFARLLELLLRNWPVRVEELTIVGHSMGGLVARSACLAGRELRHRWLQTPTRLVFLGTPHLGAPLERGGQGLARLLGVSPYSAPLSKLAMARSAGIQDLRHGTITLDGHRVVPLPKNAACYAVAASLGEGPRPVADSLLGDGLVPLDSALGRHRSRARDLRIPEQHRHVLYGMGHLDLLHRPEVFARLESWLRVPIAAVPSQVRR